MQPNDEAQPPAKGKAKRKYNLSAAGRESLRAAAAARKPWRMSTGPRTKSGAIRSAMNALQHGDRSVEVIERRREIRSLLRQVRALNCGGTATAPKAITPPASAHVNGAAAAIAPDGKTHAPRGAEPIMSDTGGLERTSRAAPADSANVGRGANPSSFVEFRRETVSASVERPAQRECPTKQKTPEKPGFLAVMGAVGFEPTKA